MKIELRSLHVKGCGPLEDVTIDFTDAEGKPRPVTVIAGANGSGKTTVLELITAHMEIQPPLAIQPSSLNAKIVSEEVRKRIEVSTKIVQKTPSSELEFNFEEFSLRSIVQNKQFTSLTPPLGGVLWDTSSADTLRLQLNSFLQLEGKPILDLPKNPPIPPSVLYFPHPRKVFPVKGSQLTDEETLYYWLYRYENAQDFQGSLDAYLCWLAFIEPERPGVFSEVTEFLDSLDFDGKKFNLKRTKLKATVTTREGHTHFLEELSAGEQNILIMLLELRRRLLPGSIVLIDEIESSLHPAYQHKLARSLLKMQEATPFQLIVTTHSRSIVEVFGTQSAVFLANF